ncbi:hypothetical protein K435DRAFT_798507 [Dendrothele bispora CBS 962.96]|uniref:Uncharacterized protein n=1 Tax=Dendrothele bispora (strain CBS 962.96) TaxID=1314807 RepID=A0A4S8LZ10_DENBC|nr:hypothetical protein K435DRAFT_798507 [Dendrothele bispora CBS 962.96]
MSGCCVLGSGPDFVTSGDSPLTPGQQPSTAGMAEGESARDSCRPMTSPNDGFIQTDNSRPETPDHPKLDMLSTPQTAGVIRPNSNASIHSDILLTLRLREESRQREIEEYERAIEEIDQEEARLKEEIRRIEGEMAESDQRRAKQRADCRNQQPRQEIKPGPRETVEPGHGMNYIGDPMTVPQPSVPWQPIPSGPSIPPVPNSAQYPPVIWPPVLANWAQCPAPPPVIWPPVPYPVQPSTSPIFPPPIPFPNLLPPLSPRQADNFSAAPQIPPLPPQIYPPALELLPETQKRSKAIMRCAGSQPGQPKSTGKKYQGGCSARVCERNNPVQGYCGGGNRGESWERGKDVGTLCIPAEPDGGILSSDEESDREEEMNAGAFESLSAYAVMGNDTSITITIPGVRTDMDSDVEVEVDGSKNSSSDGAVMGNDTSITITIPGFRIDVDSDVEVEVNGSEDSNSDGNSDVDESSSEEESSGEEENSDSDEESDWVFWGGPADKYLKSTPWIDLVGEGVVTVPSSFTYLSSLLALIHHAGTSTEPIKLLESIAAEHARVHQMARVYTTPTSRLDEDARHLTQDYPALGENLSRASSRSSTVSQASRSAYPEVPEEVLEQVSQAKTARLAARARYEAALANPDLPNSVIIKLENDLSKSEDELKFARIERSRAKFSNRNVNAPSPRSPLPPPLLALSPLQIPVQLSLRPVPEDQAPLLEQGEDRRELGDRVNAEGDFRNSRASRTTNKTNLARTERDSAELLGQRVTTLPGRPLPPSIPMSPLLQLASQFSSWPIPKNPALFFEQEEDPKKRGHGADTKTDLEDEHSQVTNEPNPARAERDHAKPWNQRATTSTRWSTPPTILTSSPLPLEDPALHLEQGVERRRMGHRINVCENELKIASTEHDRAKISGRSVANLPGLSVPTPMLMPPPLPPDLEELAPFLEWGELRRRMSNQGSGSKTGGEVDLVGEREEVMRSVHDSRAQLSEDYEYERRNISLAVPLGRGQNTLAQNVPMTVAGSESVCQHPHTRTQPSRGEDEGEVPYLVPPKVSTRTPQLLACPQELVVNSPPPPPINYLSRPLGSPSSIVTTSTQGGVSSSWVQPRNLGMPVQHIVGGFGGEGDPEGSSYRSSELDHGGGNGGGGRPPGWGDDDPDDPDDSNDGGQSGNYRPRRGHHRKDRDNGPRRGPCGGGPPGGDPPDDGKPEGGKDGNSERSNQKDSKRRRGVTPFSEIPEEGSPHYNYEYFEYKVKAPTNSKKPLKEKVFTRFTTLIEWRLFTKLKVVGDGKAQKNLINSIPKIELYKGQNSIVLLDRFLRNLIRHMEVHRLTGPSKTMDPEGTLIVTNEDTARTILMAANLTGAAQEWYQSFAERPPDSFQPGMKASAHRRTFLQVFRVLFDRFVTGAALKEALMLYEEVEYTTEGGIRQLLSDMKMYAEVMPVPLDEYRFKDSLMERLPQSMRRTILCDGISAINASLDEIMQRAIAVESGWEAEVYYDTTSSQLNVSDSETDTGGESESEQGESESEETQEQGGSGGCTDKCYVGDNQPTFKPAALRNVTSVHSKSTAPRRSKFVPTAFMGVTPVHSKFTAPMKCYLRANQITDSDQ